MDTHVFLWWAKADHRLPARVLGVLEDPESDLIFSMASLWEAALKADRIGIIEDFEALVDRATRLLRLSILTVELRHVILSARLPFHHRDPFDRILIAQASSEGIPILTGDAAMAPYPVRIIW
jgi:PIN domain nuclease of toxin-antitoxin system